MSARIPSSRRVPSTSEDVPEADRLEQELSVGADEDTGSSPSISASEIFGANEADVAEQLQEVPEDDDYPRE
ncbi:hypothetical protein [Hoyosella subflava]|uniref:Uncharacterized protein n=1 Tax=Hoyosella subflava (strain DSM 45089 / JCM 17490 / NBRC 109087 / DQS3-9A1) TaxID=443218 RepID=F6EEC0_HOYSD|nr:hypothetical protein [Hoyosella subflava]AEF38572.1 hypothetical protein AS9A_0112 [Hoyosella subflava DQS3-9A1]